jgi:hypothetical protein
MKSKKKISPNKKRCQFVLTFQTCEQGHYTISTPSKKIMKLNP